MIKLKGVDWVLSNPFMIPAEYLEISGSVRWQVVTGKCFPMLVVGQKKCLNMDENMPFYSV